MTVEAKSDPGDQAGPDLDDEGALADGSLTSLAFTAVLLGLSALFFQRSFSIDSDAEIWPKALSGLLVC